MAEKQYAYYLEGSRIAIVEKATNFSNNVDNKEFGPGVAKQEWKSPQSSVTSGIELKYTNAPGDDIEDETSIIDLPSYLCKGLVYYIKARLAEDGGNLEGKEYFMREFHNKLSDNESNRNDIFVAIPLSPYAIR